MHGAKVIRARGGPHRSRLATLAGSSPLPELSCPESCPARCGSGASGGSASGSGGTGGGRGGGIPLGAGSSAGADAAPAASTCCIAASWAELLSSSAGVLSIACAAAAGDGIASSLSPDGVTTAAGRAPVQAAPSPSPPLRARAAAAIRLPVTAAAAARLPTPDTAASNWSLAGSMSSRVCCVGVRGSRSSSR